MVTVDSYLCCFQYKIKNNILFFQQNIFLENFISRDILSVEISAEQLFIFFTNIKKRNVYGFNRIFFGRNIPVLGLLLQTALFVFFDDTAKPIS